MKRFIALCSLFAVFSFTVRPEERTDAIDFFILMDTSLSMYDAMPEAKEYVAGELVGRIAMPGDWLMVMGFFGEQNILWQGELETEEQKATLVRSLRSLEATGRFTDIGAALDLLDGIVRDRGQPERAKYILLVTDERQEAPYGSRYYSEEYRIEHRLLEYVKRQDMGLYRVLTIGYGLDQRIEGETSIIMKTLSEPPKRPSSALPGAEGVSDAAASGGGFAETGSPSSSAHAEGEPEESASLGRQGQATVSRTGLPLPAVIIGAVFLVALLAFAVLVLVRSLKRDKDDRNGVPPQ